MATYRQGNMFDCLPEVDHFIITTNAIVKKNGALVMGAGMARQVRDAQPGIDVDCGRAVQHYLYHISGATSYGCLLAVKGKLGIFQVKHHFKDQASLDLIQESTRDLHDHATMFPHLQYALNFPGIGNGGLRYDQVKPIVDQLPDNVQVWTWSGKLHVHC